MWRDIQRVMRLAPAKFRAEFDRIYIDADDIKTLCQLAGATNDYLRANPNAMDVPADLPRRLLAAQHLDTRIIGLKLLNRSPVPDAELVTAIVRALEKRDGYESCGGLYELGQFLDRRNPSKLGQSLSAELCTALTPLAHDGRNVHSAAARLLEALTQN